jgi:hypothetical protein
MNILKKISFLFTFCFFAHESVSVSFLTGDEINTIASTNTAGTNTILDTAGTEFLVAFPSSTAQHQTVVVLAPLNTSQTSITSTVNPSTALATTIGHLVITNSTTGSASAENAGITTTNTIETDASTTVDQNSGTQTTTNNYYEGTGPA